MHDSTTIPTCTKGHPLTPENALSEPDRSKSRCRLCLNETKTRSRKLDPEGSRAHAAELRRALRARQKAEDPERYALMRQRANERKKEREKELTPQQLTERWQRKNERARLETQTRRYARALNVTSAEYNALLLESTLSGDELVRDQNRPSAAWNLLKVKGDALPIWDEFSMHLESTVTPCQSSTKWTEYDDPRPGRDDERSGVPMPTRSEAQKMCRDCPLIDLCGKFAQKDRPDFGVWGGERWLGGKKLS